MIKEVFEFVHPHFRHSDPVLVNVFWQNFVGGPGPEDVADMRTGSNLDPSPTHPSLKAQLEVFTTPNFHPCGEKQYSISGQLLDGGTS